MAAYNDVNGVAATEQDHVHQRGGQGRVGLRRPDHVRLVRHQDRRAGRQRRSRPGHARSGRPVGRRARRTPSAPGEVRRGRRSTTTCAACCGWPNGSARWDAERDYPADLPAPDSAVGARSSSPGSPPQGITVLTNRRRGAAARPRHHGRADRPARPGDHRHGRRLRAGQPAVPGQRRRRPDRAARRRRHRHRRRRGPRPARSPPRPGFVTDPDTGEPGIHVTCTTPTAPCSRSEHCRPRRSGRLRRRLRRGRSRGVRLRARIEHAGGPVELGVIGVGSWQ